MTDQMKTCTGPCGKPLPATTEYFHSNGPGRLKSRCKSCASRAKPKKKKTADEKWHEKRNKRLAREKARREKKKATPETEEQRIARINHRNKSDKLPGWLKRRSRLRLILSLFEIEDDWREFYKDVRQAVQLRYYRNDGYSSAAFHEMRKDETYVLLEDLQEEVKKAQWSLTRFKTELADIEGWIARHSEEDIEFARTYVPRPYHRDDLAFLSPQEREEVMNLMRTPEELTEDEKSDRQTRADELLLRELVETYYGHVLTPASSDMTRRERKAEMSAQAALQEASEEMLSSHPNPELVAQVMRDLKSDFGADGEWFEDHTTGSEYLTENDPEAREIDETESWKKRRIEEVDDEPETD